MKTTASVTQKKHLSIEDVKNLSIEEMSKQLKESEKIILEKFKVKDETA